MKTARTSKLPPFYTHPIGSLPRPQAVRDLLARRGEMPPVRYQASPADFGRIRQMSRQVSRGSAGEDQADERAGVARPGERRAGREGRCRWSAYHEKKKQ